MLLLVASLLFFTQGSTLPNNFDYNEYLLHNVIYVLGELKLCPEIGLDEYVGKHWADLPSDKQGELFYCLSKIIWSDSSTPTCGVMMNSGKLWSQMDTLEKRIATDCGFRRFVASAIGEDLPLLSEFFSEVFLNDRKSREKTEEGFIKCFLVKKQFQSDAETDYETFSSKKTTKFWSFLGLNTSHYSNDSITDAESLEKFRNSVTVGDYILWNNLRECETTGIANVEFLPVSFTFVEIVRKEKPEWISEPVVFATKDQPWEHFE